MIKALVTGSKGFIGKNLCLALSREKEIELYEYDIGDGEEAFVSALRCVDVIYHLAGVNRPKEVGEYSSGNHGFTKEMLERIESLGRKPIIVATSSSQAAQDNPYGKSKLEAERELFAFAERNGSDVFVYRLSNVFGKWCRPFYNSVIATFCHQAAHGEAYRIDDPAKKVDFIYVDDIVREFYKYLSAEVISARPGELLSIRPSYEVSIGQLAAKLDEFKLMRQTAIIPDLSDPFTKNLYSTYLSYLETSEFSYAAEKKSDDRGYLYELVKSKSAGQLFVSRTLPGITRGNHYHDTKVEKFCVVDGEARISFRNMITNDSFSMRVEGKECRIVDIPPGYTHSISNIGNQDLITIFWANEIFDPLRPDTYYSEVSIG